MWCSFLKVVVLVQYVMMLYCLTCRDDYRGALSAEEMALLEEAGQRKALCLEAIAAREAEIRGIRDGDIKASTKVSRSRSGSVLNVVPPFRLVAVVTPSKARRERGFGGSY